MRLGLLAAGALILFPVRVLGQDSLAWKPTVDMTATLAQNAYSDNWAGGDAGSVTWVAGANLGLERQFPTSWNWRNALRLAYGQTHSQDAETNTWRRPFKSTDLIDFESLLRYLNWKSLPPYAAFRLISQFEDASDLDHKLRFNPIDLTESFGVSRLAYKRGDDEILTRAGLGLRQKIARTWTEDFSATSTTTTSDGGIEWVSDGKYKIPQSRVLWKTKLTAFKAFFYSRADELKGKPEEDYWKAVDVNWENTLSAQVAKYLVVSLYLQWLYDKEIDRGGRFKETVTIGFAWKMI